MALGITSNWEDSGMGTNAQRQAAFKARMRQAGKKQIAIWVDTQQETAIGAFLAGAAVTSNGWTVWA